MGLPGKTFLSAFLILSSLFSLLEAQIYITVNPQEHPEAVTNPGIGFRMATFAEQTISESSAAQYCTKVAKTYIHWERCETSVTEDITGLVKECNRVWFYAPTNNLTISPRITTHYIPWIGNSAPHIRPLDYTSESHRNHVLRVIRKIGKAWDKDPRVQAVETGILGGWGEQQQYTIEYLGPTLSVTAARVAPDGARWTKIMADAFKEAFPNKPLLVREMKTYAKYGNDLPYGSYWDLFASPGQYRTGTFQELQDFGDRANPIVNNNIPPKRYLVSPIFGEIEWSKYYDPNPSSIKNEPKLKVGTSGNELITNNAYSTRFANYARKVHASAINGMGVEGINKNTPNLQKILKAFGYRFQITEFSCLNRVEYDKPFTISAKIKNIGSAPIYKNYPVYFFLLKDKDSTDPIYKVQINDIDIRKWHPGSDFDWEPMDNPNGTQVYLNPPAENLISASITIPSTISSTVPVGDYYAGIAIIEPSTGKPGVFFAIPNFFAASQTQPLCQIGVGKVPASFAIPTAVKFDSMDPVNDKRSYSLAYYKTLPEVKVEVLVKGVLKTPNAETTETPKESVQVRFTRQASDPSSALKTTLPLKVTFDVGGTATAGADYQKLPASAVIPAGATSVTMDLNVLNDKIMEPNETVELTLTSNQLDYYLTNPKKVTVTIKDDTDFEVRKSVGAVGVLGSWVQGKSISRQTGANRALVVLITGRHEAAAGDDPKKYLKVNSVTYGGQAMKPVKENSFRQGPIAWPAPYTYSGAFVLEEAGIVAGGSNNNIVVAWQTPNGALDPKDGSNIMSAFFSNVSQTVLKGDLSVMNPLSNGQASSAAVNQFSFDNSATPAVEEFKNEEGDAIILAGGIPRADDGVYRINSGFTSFGEKMPDGSYRVGDSGSFYGYKKGTGVAERPTFTIYQSRKSMVGFVLKKQGYTFSEWTKAYGLTGVNAGPTVDFDKDGMSNLMEYAVGMNPTMAEADPIVRDIYQDPITRKHYLKLSVNLDPNAAKNVTVSGETTGDLKGVWSSDPLTAVKVLSPSPNFIARDQVAIEEAPKRFIRLQFK